jgi:hypothetical protein
MRGQRMLLVAAAVLMVALLLACGPVQRSATDVPADETRGPAAESTETPSTGPETPSATPEAAADSPLPTPAREERLTPEVTRLPDMVPGVTPGTPVTGEVPAALLEAIVADLAARLGIRSDEIQVVRGESVVWNDGSLGCPEPGMMYTEALVDGYWVVLEHEGQMYDYRATDRGYFRLCESPLPGLPGRPGGGETE